MVAASLRSLGRLTWNCLNPHYLRALHNDSALISSTALAVRISRTRKLAVSLQQLLPPGGLGSSGRGEAGRRSAPHLPGGMLHWKL